MAGYRLFSLRNFLKFSRTTRDKLRHYDKLGLLQPALRGNNNYRYYSSGQMAVASLIHTWLDLGMTLNEIKSLTERRTPELMDDILTRQMEKIDEKIADKLRTRQFLSTLQTSIRSVSGVDEEAVTIQSLPQEAIILGEVNDYSKGRDAFDALLSFYRYIQDRRPEVDLSYPVWAVFSADRVKRGDWKWPDRYYFYNPEGTDHRPAAQYAIGYARGGYGHSEALYTRLLDYIDKNGFEICGDAYEEYPLNEICIADGANYLKRVMITVREKQS